MKNLIINIIVLGIGILIGINLYSPYDANHDGKVNAVDYVVIKNHILNK